MRHTLVSTILSIAALLSSLLCAYYLDRWLDASMVAGLMGPSFVPPFAVGALANVLIPLLVGLMAISLFRATDKSIVAGALYLATGAFFVVLPLAIAAIPALRSIRQLYFLPFHPARMMINLDAPFSRMYYVTGFVLMLGILGVWPRLKSWIRTWLLPDETHTSGA